MPMTARWSPTGKLTGRQLSPSLRGHIACSTSVGAGNTYEVWEEPCISFTPANYILSICSLPLKLSCSRTTDSPSSPFALEEFISTLGARIINLIKYWSTTDTSGQRSDEGYGICYLGRLLDFISKSTMLDARARTRANQDAVTQSCGANREEIGWACPFKQEKRRNGGQQVMSDLNVSQNQHHLVAKRVRDHPAAQHRTGVPVRAIDMCRRPFGWAGCWSMLP